MSLNNRSILLIGSGMVTAPFIEYLLKDKRNSITVASNEVTLLNETLKKFAGKNIQGITLDVSKEAEKLEKLVSENFLVASFVPPFLHPVIAKVCLKMGRHMITSSYISDFMREISSQVKEKNLIFMNELGLDPGLDHVITHKVIYEEEKKGNKIIAYESWCGALPAPEVCNNPFIYKFSWSPKGALIAMNNKSTQIINSKVVSFEPDQTINNTVNKVFHPALNLEGYFNRDSRPYKEMYHLKDVHTVIRGTLRYKGTTFAIACLKNLGLYDDTLLEGKFSTWKQLFQDYLTNSNELKTLDKILMVKFDKEDLQDEDKYFYINLASQALSKFDLNYLKSNGGYDSLLEKAINIFTFLEFHNSKNKLVGGKSKLDEISILLENKLKMNADERDLDFMQNEFTILSKDGKIFTRKLDLLVYGNHNGCGHTATALTVGTTAAIGAQMILDNLITERGVLAPSSELLGKKIISEYEKMKIFVTEEKLAKIKF